MDFFYKNITEETANIQNKKLNTVCFILSPPPLFLGENMMRSFSKKMEFFLICLCALSPPPLFYLRFLPKGGGLSMKQTVFVHFYEIS